MTHLNSTSKCLQSRFTVIAHCHNGSSECSDFPDPGGNLDNLKILRELFLVVFPAHSYLSFPWDHLLLILRFLPSLPSLRLEDRETQFGKLSMSLV